MPPAADALLRDAPATDIHIHPSLMSFLYGEDKLLRDDPAVRTPPDTSMSTARATFPRLRAGGLRVLWAAHHIPEMGFFRNPVARVIAQAESPTYRRKGIQVPYLPSLRDQIAGFEAVAEREGFLVASRPADVRAILASGKRAVVHTLEGAHHLEDTFQAEGAAGCIRLLRSLRISSVVVAHIFANRFSAHIDALPPSLAKTALCLDSGADPAGTLTDDGVALVEALVEAGIMIDTMHAAPAARRAILDISAGAPVLASHTGVAAMFNNPYNLEDPDIERIAAGGGLIGVIAMPHWLVGSDRRRGIRTMLDTMKHIRSVAGSWKHVAIGSDFDGFTDPCDDFRDASQYPDLVQAMLDSDLGLAEQDVLDILGGNAQRVLEQGWKPPA